MTLESLTAGMIFSLVAPATICQSAAGPVSAQTKCPEILIVAAAFVGPQMPSKSWLYTNVVYALYIFYTVYTYMFRLGSFMSSHDKQIISTYLYMYIYMYIYILYICIYIHMYILHISKVIQTLSQHLRIFSLSLPLRRGAIQGGTPETSWMASWVPVLCL